MKSILSVFSILLKNSFIKELVGYIRIGGFFIIILLGVCWVFDAYMLPYFLVRQSENQKAALENELYSLPQAAPRQWQQFEKLIMPLNFSEDKIRIALKSIANSHHIILSDCNFTGEKVVEDKVKKGTFILTSLLDSRIFYFLNHLQNKLPGVLSIKMVKLHRNRELTEELLSGIKSGQVNDLVKAEIGFEWLTF